MGAPRADFACGDIPFKFGVLNSLVCLAPGSSGLSSHSYHSGNSTLVPNLFFNLTAYHLSYAPGRLYSNSRARFLRSCASLALRFHLVHE